VAGRTSRLTAVAPVVALAFALTAVGCSGGTTDPASEDGGPRRVGVLAPAAAEMLDALGLDDRVVGVGEFGPWPAPLRALPTIGGYDTPNAERVLELRCDAVITTRSEAALDAHRRLEALGVRVVALDTATFDGVFDALAEIGRLFDRGNRADELAARMRRELDDLAARAASAEPRRVLVVVGRDPLYVAGPGSYLDELVRRAGGINVAGDPGSPYRRISVEAILERAPEVIVDTSDNTPGAVFGRRPGRWARWDTLPAVAEDRVYHVHPGRLAIPGIRLPEMAQLMGRLIHPEIFGAPTDAALGPP